MAIYLLDNSLRVEIYYEQSDSDFADNICVSICEDCPDSEKILRVDQTNLFITKEEARNLALALLEAVVESDD